MSGPRLWARTLRGLEQVVADEAKSRGLQVDETLDRGLILSGSRLRPALDLRACDDLFILAGAVRGLGPTRSGLARIIGLVEGEFVRQAAEVRSELRPSLPLSQGLEVVASFVGRRNYNRFDIEDAVGERLASLRPADYWSRRHGPPPLGAESWRVVIEGEGAWLGLRVEDVPLHRRAYRVAPGPGALHPPLAAGMALLAGLRSGHRLLDPCAGSGTIPIEACLLEPGLESIASDIDGLRLQIARESSARAGVEMHSVVADVADPVFHRSTMDRVISDFPWGGQVAWAGGQPEADRLWGSLAYLLAPEGRFAVLTPDPGRHSDMIESAGLLLRRVVPVSLSGTRVAVLVGGHLGSTDH